MDTREISKQVRALRKLNMEKENLEAKIEEIKDTIKKVMDEQKTDELVGKDYKVTWKWVHSEIFDTKRFKAEHEKLAKRYTKGSDKRRFNVA